MNHLLPKTALAAALLAALAACSSAKASPDGAARTGQPTGPRASACAGATYTFTPIDRTTTLAYLSSAHRLAAPGPVPNGLMALRSVRAEATSSAGAEDARAAYAAFLKQLARDDAAPLGGLVGTPTAQFVSSGAGTFAVYRAPDVFTAQFARTCGSNPDTAYGTVTTWANPRDGIVQCGTTNTLPAHAELARRLACH